MPVHSRALGAHLESVPVEVTLRSALAYAAAIGQTGDCTFDDARDLIVVPQFCVTLEWLVVTGGRRQELLGLTADEARQVVHVEQDSQFHRGIQPGDRVRVRGRVLQIRSTRAGASPISSATSTARSTGRGPTCSRSSTATRRR